HSNSSYDYLLTLLIFSFFFFTDTATTEIYTLSLHDALPISHGLGDRALERGEVDAAFGGGRGRTELHRELPLERGRRRGVDEHARHDVVHSHLDPGDLIGGEVMTCPEVEERVDGGVGQRTRRIRLDRHAGLEHVPALAESVECRRERSRGDGRGARRHQESLLAVEGRLRRREAFTR